MGKIFNSPQTKSEYVMVTLDDSLFVGVRFIGHDPIFKFAHYRITLRGEEDVLKDLKLGNRWTSGVKENDHRSAVVMSKYLTETVDEGIAAVKGVLGDVTMSDTWEDDLKILESTPIEIQCPLCGAGIQMGVPEDLESAKHTEMQ